MATNFSVSPMSQNLALIPGETTEGTISVVNPSGSEQDFRYQVKVLPFSITEDGQVDTQTIGAYSQMVHWISVPEGVGTVPPNGIEKVHFSIDVPEDAAGGSQAAAIVIVPETEAAEGDGVQVSNSFPIASVVYATVAGEIHHDVKIVENTLPSFAFSPPVYATAKLLNDGNTYETADVTLTVTNLITGEKILAEDSANTASSGSVSKTGADNVTAETSQVRGNTFTEVVMPSNSLAVARSINGLPIAGVVQLEQTIKYGGETSTVSSNLVICPIWLIVAVLVALGVIIGGIVALVRRIKRRRAGLAI